MKRYINSMRTTKQLTKKDKATEEKSKQKSQTQISPLYLLHLLISKKKFKFVYQNSSRLVATSLFQNYSYLLLKYLASNKTENTMQKLKFQNLYIKILKFVTTLLFSKNIYTLYLVFSIKQN